MYLGCVRELTARLEQRDEMNRVSWRLDGLVAGVLQVREAVRLLREVLLEEAGQ